VEHEGATADVSSVNPFRLETKISGERGRKFARFAALPEMACFGRGFR
jgi:hypothetical protein